MSDFLKKQLETTETTIKALQEHAKSLRSMMEKEAPKKWSPVGGEWRVVSNGSVDNWISDKDSKEFGLQRPTQQQAQNAAIEMRKFNRLLSLRDELCGDEVVDWLDASSFKYTLEFIAYENKWFVDATRIYHKITVYFSTKESAQRACEMLNSGEVEL